MHDAERLGAVLRVFHVLPDMLARKWGEGNYATGRPSRGYRCRTKKYLQRKGAGLSFEALSGREKDDQNIEATSS